MSADSQTYTLPLALIVVLVLCGIAALVMLYQRRRQLQEVVEQEFKSFREKAMALMDQLDALRRRHETLPSTDPDFTKPMSGATLALYNAVEADLNNLWERWLKVMEVWDHAQKLVRSGSGLAVRQAEQARKLLDQGDIDDLLRQSATCKERLDRLNMGHEQARAELAEVREELAARQKSSDHGPGGHHRSDARDGQIVRAETILVEADQILVADPIGAADMIIRAHRLLAAPVNRTGRDLRNGRDLDRSRGGRPPYSPLDDLAAAADAFRAAAAKLRLTNLLGLFVRFWLIVWGFSLLIGLMHFLMPLVIVVAGSVFVLGGFWAIWQTVTFWFWYGMWGAQR